MSDLDLELVLVFRFLCLELVKDLSAKDVCFMP